MTGTEETEQATSELVAQQPILRIVNADATPEEVAAIVAVFSALGSGTAEKPKRKVPGWSANHRRMRANHPHGPGGWRSSGLPR